MSDAVSALNFKMRFFLPKIDVKSLYSQQGSVITGVWIPVLMIAGPALNHCTTAVASPPVRHVTDHPCIS